MEFPIKYIATIAIVVVVLIVFVSLFLSRSGTLQIEAKNTFTQGCIKYCSEIEQTGNIGSIAITKAEELEGTDFINACKLLYPDIKYNWQCWNRGCCKFSVYPAI